MGILQDLIVQYIGRRGAGKTLTMTKDVVNYYYSGWKIYTNYDLYGIEYTKLTNDEIINLINLDHIRNCVIAIDEIQTVIDSRKFAKDSNMDFTYFIQQIRKRGIVLLATSQFLDNVEKRFRQHIDLLVKPRAVYMESGNWVVTAKYIDSTSEEDTGEVDMVEIVYNPFNIISHYSTIQEQKSKNISSEKEKDKIKKQKQKKDKKIQKLKDHLNKINVSKYS